VGRGLRTKVAWGEKEKWIVTIFHGTSAYEITKDKINVIDHS
jgi:hypothetical protein